MYAFLLCMVLYTFSFNWQVYLIQLLSKLNDFQNRHSAVFFVKVITLSKVPLLKICFILQTFSFEICTDSSYLLCFKTESRIIMETNKSQVVFSYVEKLSSKSFKDFLGNIVHNPFLPQLVNFWSVCIWTLNHQCNTEGLCNIWNVWKATLQ